MSAPYVANPEAIGDPNQTPEVVLPGWDAPCSDCDMWDAQLMFNGTWAARVPCDRHRGEPIDGLPGLSLAEDLTTDQYGVRHDASGLVALLLADSAASAARLVDIARPHLAAVDWTVDRATLLDSEAAFDAYKSAKSAVEAAGDGVVA